MQHTSVRQVRVAALWLSLLLGACALGHSLRQKRLPCFVERRQNAIVGVYHLHTEHSHDSFVPQSRYVQAARALGLNFIVLTDHNAQPEIKALAEDVCVVAAAELSTSFGHVVGLGATRLLSAEARREAQVLHHISSVGGSAIVAHPSDAKRPWTGPYPKEGGLEIANWAASARRRGHQLWPQLIAAPLAWFVNTPLLLAQAYDRDDAALELWDAPERAALAGFCAIDAHGWLAPSSNLLAWQLVLDDAARPPSQKAVCEPIVKALRGGHFYCAAGLLGRAPKFEFMARKKTQAVARNGDVVAQSDVDCLVALAPALSVGKSRLVVRCDGQIISDAAERSWQLCRPATGVYRVELWAELPQLVGQARAVPVLFSNKLTVTA